jgi:hypothetical protein
MSACLSVVFRNNETWSPSFLTMGPRIALLQERPKVIAGRHFSATVAWDHISARMTYGARMTLHHKSSKTTYVMWRQQYVWDVSVLRRVSSLVLCIIPCSLLHVSYRTDIFLRFQKA